MNCFYPTLHQDHGTLGGTKCHLEEVGVLGVSLYFQFCSLGMLEKLGFIPQVIPNLVWCSRTLRSFNWRILTPQFIRLCFCDSLSKSKPQFCDEIRNNFFPETQTTDMTERFMARAIPSCHTSISSAWNYRAGNFRFKEVLAQGLTHTSSLADIC